MSLIRKAYNSFFSDEKDLSSYIRSITGTTPTKPKLFRQVFRHRSAYASAKENNERLELLGDSVLDLLVAEFLFKKYPYKEEGFITEMRSKIVNRASLNMVGKKLGLLERLETNRRSIHETPKDLAGNAFEALIGAIYLDAGLDAARKFVHKRVLQNIIDVDTLEVTMIDFKSRVFHYTQRHNVEVVYDTKAEELRGRRAYFSVRLVIDGKEISTGEGYSKKGAEQIASMKALQILNANLKGEELPNSLDEEIG
ncbi:MAG TPA: ribonuclease III [Chitinophagales bacterium]